MPPCFSYNSLTHNSFDIISSQNITNAITGANNTMHARTFFTTPFPNFFWKSLHNWRWKLFGFSPSRRFSSHIWGAVLAALTHDPSVARDKIVHHKHISVIGLKPKNDVVICLVHNVLDISTYHCEVHYSGKWTFCTEGTVCQIFDLLLLSFGIAYILVWNIGQQ